MGIETEPSCSVEGWPGLPQNQEQPYFDDDCDSDGEISGFVNRNHIPAPRNGELREDLRAMFPENELFPDQMEQATTLIQQYEDIFIGLDGRVGFTNRVQHNVDTGDSSPIRTPPYRRS